jgi:hypothetical protein
MRPCTNIEAYFAGICEPVEAGICAYGAVVKIVGKIHWTDAKAAWDSAGGTVNIARYTAQLRLCENSAICSRSILNAQLLATDSKQTIMELRGEWNPSINSTLLEEAVKLVREAGTLLTLRYVSRRENLAAHTLARQLRKRHGVDVSERYVRPAPAPRW